MKTHRTRNWSQVYSGRLWYFDSPSPEDFTVTDLAHQLALTNRFHGATFRPYSVAEHSLFVARCLELDGRSPRFQLLGLLHDAHEAYSGDIVRPLKWVLDSEGAIDDIESAEQAAIMAALGVPLQTKEEKKTVKLWDNSMLLEERSALLRPTDDVWSVSGVAVPVEVSVEIRKPRPAVPEWWRVVEELFTQRLYDLMEKCGRAVPEEAR